MELTIDFETRSAFDIRKGPWPYAEHPSTQVMCLAIKPDDGEPLVWIPQSVAHLYGPELFSPEGFSLTDDANVKRLLDEADTIEAHNLEFEIAMWTNHMIPIGFPDLREEPHFSKLRCTASVAAMHALPRSLNGACEALALPVQKDKDGHKLMLKLCKPRRPRKAEKEADPEWEAKLWWNEEPADLYRQCVYCARDVNAEHCLSQRLGELPAMELAVWRADQKANWRGVMLDQELCRKMITLREELKGEMVKESVRLCGVKPSQPGKLIEVLSGYGVITPNLKKETVLDLLDIKSMHPDARRLLEIRQSCSKTSLAKLDAGLAMICRDGALRSTLMYHGAGTGRWTAKGMQLQNLPSRGLVDCILECIDLILAGADVSTLSLLYPDPAHALVSCIRGVIVAREGMDFYSADFSSIEGRVLAWLAGDNHIIEAYKEGLDMYKIAATTVYGIGYDDVTKDQRRVGKIPELGGGYQGGWRAYMGFAIKERLRVPAEIMRSLTEDDYWEWFVEEEKRTAANRLSDLEAGYCKWFSPIVKAWRDNRPGTTALWRGLGDAALKAVQDPGVIASYGPIRYGVSDNFLQCLLPSGRVIYYYAPRIVQRRGKPSLTYMSTDSITKRWQVTHGYGGKFTENAVQGIARDLMCYGWQNIKEADSRMELAFTVHDEIIAEGPEGAMTLEDFEELMADAPEWADGCPVEAEGWIGKRYRK